MTLSGGVLTYRDRREGTEQRIEAINASVKLPSLDQPMTFDGGLTWNKEAIAGTIDFSTASRHRSISPRSNLSMPISISR